MSDKDEMLREAAAQFRYYAEQHRAKGTEEGNRKAEVNDQYAENCEVAARGQTQDLLRDRKFKIVDGRLVNRVSGVAIPEHEPVFIFRARDRHSLAVLRFYESIVLDPHHRSAIGESIHSFANFAMAHPEQMKEPGITHDFKLTSGYMQELTPLGGLGVPAPKQDTWNDVWERFGRPVITHTEGEPDDMGVTAIWSDGERTTINFRNFRQPAHTMSRDYILQLFHERRFDPLEQVASQLA